MIGVLTFNGVSLSFVGKRSNDGWIISLFEQHSKLNLGVAEQILDQVVSFIIVSSLVLFHIGFHIHKIGAENAGDGMAVEGDPDLVIGDINLKGFI
jgi:hypothetical protein